MPKGFRAEDYDSDDNASPKRKVGSAPMRPRRLQGGPHSSTNTQASTGDHHHNQQDVKRVESRGVIISPIAGTRTVTVVPRRDYPG